MGPQLTKGRRVVCKETSRPTIANAGLGNFSTLTRATAKHTPLPPPPKKKITPHYFPCPDSNDPSFFFRMTAMILVNNEAQFTNIFRIIFQ